MIVPSVLDGFDLTVLRVREWLRCAHPKKVVVQSRLVGCLVGILVWRMVR